MLATGRRVYRQVSPTGLTIWTFRVVEDGSMEVIWLGPGARLYLGLNATKPDGTMTRIEWPGADGTYMTSDAAQQAALRFIGAPLIGD